MFGLGKKISLVFALLVIFSAFASAGTVTRTISSAAIDTGQSVTVILTVDITGSETYYAIDETLPGGWAVSNNGGGSTNQAGHLKWVVYENAVDTDYTYILISTASGTSNFSGVYMFEGMSTEQIVTGDTQVVVNDPPQCTDTGTYDGQCTGQICCGGACTNLVCSVNGSCDDTNSATLDVCNNGASCTASCSNTLITTCTNGDNYCPSTCDSTNDSDCILACGNFIVDVGENCSNCPSDVNCSSGQICCGTSCTAASCSSSDDCSDGDSCTSDVCNNAGTCTASCSNTAISGCDGGTPLGGDSPGGGSSGNHMTITIEGNCLGQPIMLTILNQTGNPMEGVSVLLSKDRKTIETRKSPDDGKLSYILDQEGEYMFYLTKNYYYAETKRVNVTSCVAPKIIFDSELDEGQIQIITLVGEDGNAITAFTVVVTYPDQTTEFFSTTEGIITLPLEEKGTYTATVLGAGFEQTISFEAKNPLQLVPNISPTAAPTVEAVFGEETVEEPNYLIIWILAIAIISGMIIQVTKLKPGWFRIFMALTYTLLPLVVNYYTKNLLAAFVIIVIETILLNAMYFTRWKERKVKRLMKNLESSAKQMGGKAD